VTESCPVCPLAQDKAAAGEQISPACTQHCENCGNGVCDLDETSETCATDCRTTGGGGGGGTRRCGDGICQVGEAISCPRDCGPQDPL
jgi:hypothetical protein